MTDALLKSIGEKFPLEKIDAGDLAVLKASGMRFTVEAYNAAGLGRVSVMRASGFLGLMKMDTLIVTPTELDLPLYSYDRILAFGKDTLIVEVYDTLLGEDHDTSGMMAAKDRYLSLPDRDPGTHWYDGIKMQTSISKKGGKAHSSGLSSLAAEHFAAYFETPAEPISPSEREAKLTRSAVYVNGLLEQGGPSTDVFKKSLGREKTERLFKSLLFGI